jgi:4-hydroxy-tetrahydrodipicolinate synthase
MDAVAIPVVVQDHPASSGVQLPVDLLAALEPAVVKAEAPPTAPKVAALLAAAPRTLVVGGLGAVALIDELDAGTIGTMTGFAFPELLCAIVRAHLSGDRGRAARLYCEALPLLLFEAQPGFGAAIRKEILVRRGVIASARTRGPSRSLDRTTTDSLNRLLDHHAARL